MVNFPPHSNSPHYTLNCPRRRFILNRLGRLAFMHLLNDAICCYTVSTPHGSFPHIEHLKPTVGYMDQHFLRKLWFSWVHIIVHTPVWRRCRVRFPS
jgi:hypothetical protein